MNPLYLLQFACLIFMLINAFILAVTHLHVSWKNKRFERSRGMILIAMIGLALQYFMQMFFRIQGDRRQLGCYNQHPDLYPLLHPHLHGYL